MKAFSITLLVVLLLTLAGCGEKTAGSKTAAAVPVVQAKGLTPEEKFTEMKRKAEAGDVVAQNKLGLMYASGDGVLMDSTKAMEWYQKAAAHEKTGTAPDAVADNWRYGTTKDEMRGTVTNYAINESVNTVNFAFPYAGAQHGTIMVSNKTVLFYVKKGQVICNGSSEYGACFVLVKFDDGKADYVRARKSGDDSTTIAIESILNRIKKSKKLKIQVEVYHEGLPVFDFNVGGLNQK